MKRHPLTLLAVAIVLGIMLASCIPIFGPLGESEQVNVFSNISNGLSQ